MAPSFLTRMRNGPQTFNKEQVSVSTVSLPQQVNDIAERPATSNDTTRTPPEFVPSAGIWHPEQQSKEHETMHKPSNMQALEKSQGMSLRKRFFSSKFSSTTGAMQQPMMNGDGMNMVTKDKTGMMMPANGSMDMTMVLQAIEQRFSQHFEVARLEPVVQIGRSFEKQKEQYQWQDVSDPPYPPHCKSIPKDVNVGFLEMFDLTRLIHTTVSMLPEIPRGISYFLFGEPMAPTMAQVEDRMKLLTRNCKNIGSVPSIANRSDWFTDAVFAQQSFSGPNPTSIMRASAEWIYRFTNAANAQGNKAMYMVLTSAMPDCMYIQDCSYFRSACGDMPSCTLQSDDGMRYGCASVTLFQLSRMGILHPLAIILDYRKNIENSTCIFNQRLSPNDSSDCEATDWPWRYAKMCSQVADWTRHELAIHLTECHFVMEATIVAAQRAFPSDHVIYNMMAPHWLKTLSLNAAARTNLVPDYINCINGFSRDQTYCFINDAYKRFNWTAHYIPNDLKRRGFTSEILDSKILHNYVWGKNMSMMWAVLYKFVSSMLATVYSCDDDVMNDIAVQNWCAEMHSPTGGQMASFPDIRTLDDLTNAVVMCIHIASPQHNSVNYLQDYYMSFVPNKPACLMAPLPKNLNQLMQYGEKEIMAALPVKNPQIWLMSSQLPHLLSHSVPEGQTLASYAQTLEAEARMKKGPKWEQVEKAASDFHSDLMGLGVDFNNNSEMMDDRLMPYHAMDPTEMAISIMI